MGNMQVKNINILKMIRLGKFEFRLFVLNSHLQEYLVFRYLFLRIESSDNLHKLPASQGALLRNSIV